MEDALQTIRQKSVAATRTAAYFMIASGLVFACLGGFEIIKTILTGRYWIMTFITPALAAVFIVAGQIILRTMKKKNDPLA
jgi:hypothetical protein